MERIEKTDIFHLQKKASQNFAKDLELAVLIGDLDEVILMTRQDPKESA